MARVKRGNVLRKRHQKVLKYARGFYGSRSTIFVAANQAIMQAWKNAYRDRRKRKRDFRKLWIARINAACRLYGLSYSRFIHLLSKANICINRKMLAHLAVHEKEVFAELSKRILSTNSSK